MAKILIIRFSSIGDIILTTPVMRCLKAQVPDSEIHFLTKEENRSLVENNPHIDKVHCLKDDLNAVITDLKQENFDDVVDLHHNIRSSVVKRKLGVRSHSFRKLNAAKWLLVNFKIDYLPTVHIVDRYMQTISHLGVFNDGKGLDYFIPESEQFPLRELPQEHQNGFIAFGIGGKFFTKRLPNAKIITICNAINKPIILLGGKEDKVNASIIKEDVGEMVFDCCGKTTINQTASLVKNADIVISHDTAVMHMTAAFNKELISVWGNTIPKFGMYPYFNEENKSRSHII